MFINNYSNKSTVRGSETKRNESTVLLLLTKQLHPSIHQERWDTTTLQPHVLCLRNLTSICCFCICFPFSHELFDTRTQELGGTNRHLPTTTHPLYVLDDYRTTTDQCGQMSEYPSL